MKYFHPGSLTQRPTERIAYSFDAGATPSNLSATLYAVAADGSWSNVSSTKLSGSPSAAGTVITLPYVVGLEDGADYVLEAKYDAGGNTFAPLLALQGVT